MQKFRRMHLAAVVVLTLFCTMAFATMGNEAEAAREPTQLGDVPSEPIVVDAQDLDAAALAWLADEMQMSVDPTDAPLSIVPDYKCMDPPHNCPATTKCPWLAFGGAMCHVTSCGTGSCPICPSLFPGLLVKSWCAFGCMKGKKMVGGAFMIQTRFRWLGPVCIPA